MKSKIKFLVGLLAAVIVGAGVAYAAGWIFTVHDPASAGKFGSLSVTAGVPVAPTSNPCFPGATCDGTLTITNSGNTDLKVTGFTSLLAGASDAVVTGGTGCQDTDVVNNVSVMAKTGLSIAVPKGATTTVTIPGLYTVSSSVPTGCQGASFVMTPQTGMWNVTVGV